MTTDWELYREFYQAHEAGTGDDLLQALWDRFAATLTPLPAGWTVMDLFREKATGGLVLPSPVVSTPG
jgi:hypothetical protein